jgi:hypothetical protein
MPNIPSVTVACWICIFTHVHATPAGSTDNAALALLSAAPNLNIVHALYVLSRIPCLADLSVAIVKVV